MSSDAIRVNVNECRARGAESNVSSEIRQIEPRKCLILICMNLCGEEISTPVANEVFKRLLADVASVFPPLLQDRTPEQEQEIIPDDDDVQPGTSSS
ncbi:hypothetical protein TNCT_727431 [Trichonephila clavata]|uniref:Uncharacterized protein n=1 Tax=Trichonephila clavata TaxID=2740835 RepID=A0A8X6FSD7_TRICU|nr:hypothetical protein TNCT_727431 [Trichonephila clavata]